MDTLNGMVCFLRSAESGSFANAARRLGLTPAAVGKNVARLEAELGVRLFQRSTRRLSLTEAGEAFRLEVAGSLDHLQVALANARAHTAGPMGVLRISLPNAFGREYIVPMLGDFLRAYPGVRPDWHFDNRPVDLIAEGFDVALGGGFDLRPGVVARALAPAHRILVASPAYLASIPTPETPADLAGRDGILIRSPQTGRIRDWMLTHRKGAQASIELDSRIVFDDPDATCQAAAMGMGIALLAVQSALPWIERGALRRVLPDWWVEGGNLSIYYSAQKMLPQKTRVFIDHVVETFKRQNLAARFSATHPVVM
ncbi:MAG TPA: LysR family transcriptional regulator [Pinirhizobacter sp.]|uniref:LysR family transcriptional regulator n=1 Tax=Pinirhizobacter sp. TaxID=2950432 RepID=UPI002D144670|nr:LysR family transcriptional regulator [Pinirhizobacter sp.]HMH67700.1 LysR family transcriptional regulator [Pinirhizobacter sp.]